MQLRRWLAVPAFLGLIAALAAQAALRPASSAGRAKKPVEPAPPAAVGQAPAPVGRLDPLRPGETLRGAAIRVSAGKVLFQLSPLMIGANLEDLNYQCYGGLYSQLLYGESFQEHVDSAVLGLVGRDRLQVFIEENDPGGIEVRGWAGRGWNPAAARQVLGLAPGKGNAPITPAELPPDLRRTLMEKAAGDEQVSRHWCKRQTGSARGALKFERKEPFVGHQSQRITFVSGEGEFGIDNAGLNRWGINLVAGRPYEGLVRVKAEKDCTAWVSLLSADGARTLAGKALDLKAAPGEYQRVAFTLTPAESDEKGRFAISLKQPGSVVVGYAFLEPGEWGRFKGLPLRKDLVEAVIAQGVKVIRYDGSMVSKCPDGHLYKWKEMIGPRDLRKPYHGLFDPYASHGFAIFDFLNLCEAAGFLPIPGIRTDETPQDMTDFVEYVNGPAESPWGRRRAADGHPQPYNLRHLEIGNEERLDEAYCERFETLGAAVWARDPGMTLLITHNLGGKASDWAVGPDGAPSPGLKLAVRLVRFARDRGGKVWWDCHYKGDGLRDADLPDGRIAAMRNLKASIACLVPDHDFRIAPLEENGAAHDMGRAISHAHNFNTLARMGSYLPAVAVANTLQASGQELVWSQGRTFFTASKVWFQPPWYVDQMISGSPAPNVVAADVAGPRDALDALARMTEDRKALVLQVVNLEPAAVEAAIALDGFRPARPAAAVAEIGGDLQLENTLEAPARVVPARREWEHKAEGGAMTYTFPPYSFTILRFE